MRKPIRIMRIGPEVMRTIGEVEDIQSMRDAAEDSRIRQMESEWQVRNDPRWASRHFANVWSEWAGRNRGFY